MVFMYSANGWEVNLEVDMALLYLRQEELEVLSLVNGRRTNYFSVFNKMEGFDKSSFENNRQAHIAAINDFIKDGAMWRSEDGKPHLIRELQAAFNILNSPERTLCIRTASSQPIGEHYYSSIGDKGVLFSIGKGGEFYSVGYPFDDDLFSQWLSDEIIGDFDHEINDIEEIKCTLSGDEFNLVTVIMMHKRYGLNKDSGGVKIKDIREKDISREIERVNFIKIKPQTVQKISGGQNLEDTIGKLSSKGLLAIEDDCVKVNELLLKSFDPESLKDVVEVSEIGPFKRAKNLYISSQGYMTVEPVASNPVTWTIELFGHRTKAVEVYDRISEFSPVQIKKDFAEEIKRHVK